MKKKNILQRRKIPLIATLISASLLVACVNDDDKTIIESKIGNPYELVVTALGGELGISEAAHLSYHVNGKAYEFQEKPEPVSDLVSSYRYDIIASQDSNKIRQQWQINNDYAYDVELAFTEIIDNNQGVVIGGPNSFGAYVFGRFGVSSDPMNAAKLSARKKTWFMSSPLAIVASIIENGSRDELTTKIQGYKVSLQLDDESHLPKFAETLEFDPLLGDVIYKVEYGNWRAVRNTFYPHKITHVLDGHVIRVETLENVQFSELDQTNFDFSGVEPNVQDADKEASGYLLSQYYLRSLMMGFPFDGIDETKISSDFIDSENKVLRILGIEHYSYAFLIDDQVYIYDAALSNNRQKVVLSEVQKKFPGKEIGGVILSHNHFDHAGGFRGALAQGGELYVGSASANFYQELLTRPHTLQHNPLASRGLVTINAVTDKLTLGSGTESLDIYTIAEGHAEENDMLVLYRPSDKTLFNGDLYNSGFAGLQGIYPELALTIKKRAQFLVDFVELHDLDVEFVATTHGDVVNDMSYESVKAAALF